MIGFENHSGLNLRKIFGEGGLISDAFNGFEVRPQQLTMARSVQDAFGGRHHLAVEAGTGVGKSFAYLAGAIDKVQDKKGKVLISTYTITLQEQLINKDIPFLSKVMPCSFTARLAKGRGNYLCLRRLAYALRRQKGLFDDMGAELSQIKDWAQHTEDGSLSDLPFVPSAQAWDAVKSEHGNCPGRKCRHFRECFYRRARRELETADIIVANHALLFSDLALKQEAAGILPQYRFVVIDEAHNMENVATEYFGINISNFTISYLLGRLYNNRTGKGLLAFSNFAEAVKPVEQCRKAAKNFFAKVRSWYEQKGNETAPRCYANFVDDSITGSIRRLRLAISGLAKKTDDEDEKRELTRYVDRCRDLETDLLDFLNQPDEKKVYWVEAGATKSGRTSLRSGPVNVGPDVKRCLFDEFDSVVMTSATLSCEGEDEKGGFGFFAGRIGLEEFKALKLGSPFDYHRHVTMYIEADLPDPNLENFIEAAAETVKKYLLKTGGRAFVLFTSYSMLKKLADELKGWLADNKMELLRQDAGIDRSKLLHRFKADERSVLFGTDSFWQGVDVPGQALSNVIITKLPFAVPNHPLIQGRIEQIRAEGGNPFYKYQLPGAILKFKQGFGRLIRNKTDSGIIVVLDSRIVRKTYGRQFLAAIPNCRVEVVLSDDKNNTKEWSGM
ncbi:MAG TPA: DEAD/DEAH box helicase family protein [Planctomycetes bacterium]|nr:DEAD/DEAH box helicase family protein [Planctomycetota bacterium]HIJ71072.1 DEAD/DEAH box helicase family protein [Planctomycetota bacterium]